MIRSFGDKDTEALFRDERVRRFAGLRALPSGSSNPLMRQAGWRI
jgi:hypothetical protein